MDARTSTTQASGSASCGSRMADLGLAALALGLAVVAPRVFPSLALPLFLGGIGVGARGKGALAPLGPRRPVGGERAAYVIPAVLAYAAREASMERRRGSAALIRRALAEPGPGLQARTSAAADELDALAAELADPELDLDPSRAVACMRLLSDLEGSPLLNRARPPEDLRSRVRQIRSGFGAR